MSDVTLSRLRPVRLWLLAAAAMIFLTLIVGGATRLTESGLSITEWKPVTGVVPPVSRAAWQAEFDGYKQIPQYRELNEGMTLGQFKIIYWWEWTHRLLARTVGMVFLLPFLFFLWRRMIPKHLQWRLWGIFAGGAALGVVGWWMVSSGLAGTDRVSVSQYRLAFHLTLACAIFAAILWTAQQLRSEAPRVAPPRLRLGALAIMLLVLLQIYLGALVAGSGAGLAYNTWPLIDGSFIPPAESLFHMTPAWRNVFENILTVQFDHRMVAYTIWIVALLHAVDARRSGRAAGSALAVATLVTLQAALGIVTLLHQVALPLALTHQMFAVVVFTVTIVHAERLSHREVARAACGCSGAGGMIEVEPVDKIAVLRMQHGRANALDLEFCQTLAARFEALRDEAAAVVLTGGGTIFSAGVDLKRLSAGGADYVRAFLPALQKLYEAVFFHPKPVVAAINGHAVAGGAILACCADRRIMGHESGRIGVTELLVGVPFPALAFEVLRAAVPAEYLAEFAYSGATYITDDALESGWVDEIAEPEELIEDALAVAQELAALPPAAFALTKAQIRSPIAERLAVSGEEIDREVTALWCADETLARVRDYVARTLTK